MDLTSSIDKLSIEDANAPPIDELVKIYQKAQQRKQKQCEYQKNYMERKKKEVTGLELQLQQLQEQNQKLIAYYQLFELLRLQNPQLSDQLVNQLRIQNSVPQVTLPNQIGSPALLGTQFHTSFSPSIPMVSLKK